jgi:putative oxidoreductase
MQSSIGFLGRLCLAAIFLLAGGRILLDWQAAEQHLVAGLCDWLSIVMGNQALQEIIEAGINECSMILFSTLFLTLGGGLLVLLGLSVRFGAFMLLLFMLFNTVLYHHFWTLHGLDRQVQMETFVRNIGIIGGLLLLMAYGRGVSKKPKEKNST